MNPYLTIKKSNIHSNGVYAKRDILKGMRVIEYVGDKITKAEAECRALGPRTNHKKNLLFGAVYIFYLNKRYDIDGNVSDNLARFINHSCDPNCETEIIRGKIWIIALRDIHRGDELTYNYGYDWEDYEDHVCRCGAGKCVGFILAEEYWPRLKRKLDSRLLK